MISTRLRPRPEANEPAKTTGADALGTAYAYLQIWIGIIAFTVPIVLVLGNWALVGSWEDSLQGSISAYYYTQMHAWFIGTQFALGVFLLSYNYKALDKFKLDNRVSSVACVLMIIVALIPTVQPGKDTTFGSVFHLASAGTVFVILAWFALRRFTLSDGKVTRYKLTRNKIYRVCGWIIAASLLILLVFLPLPDSWKTWHPTLVFESVMIFAFGFSWLIKGGFRGWFADKPDPTSASAAEAISPAPPGTG
ncbi:MAG: hypothetical protein ACHQIG_07715 [Acidimicrobiia bacterium]